MILRDGTATDDARLDRLIEFDERSRGYPIRALLDTRPPIRSYTWRCLQWFDQGAEGACVGFALAHELAARPVEVRIESADWIRGLYHDAQRIDPWPGGSYPGAVPQYEGTSVLSGLKALHARGAFESYRWAFGLDDVLRGIAYHGPAVLGLNWREGMFETDPNGFIHATGPVLGGHAILAYAVGVRSRTVRLRNSWGQAWGALGDALVSWDDLGALLDDDGEAAFLVGRKWDRKAP